jgi:hypothetical protein
MYSLATCDCSTKVIGKSVQCIFYRASNDDIVIQEMPPSKKSKPDTELPAVSDASQNRSEAVPNDDIGSTLRGVESALDDAPISSNIPVAVDLAFVKAEETAAPSLPLALQVAGGNRARFMAGVQPAKVTCDVSSLPLTPGIRWSFKAVCIVVYPASSSPPERRYVLLADAHGTTGITVWNANVKALGSHAVGLCVSFTRLAITVHNGKKSLTMTKESSVHVESSSYDGSEATWWRGLLTQRPLTALQFQEATEDTIVNVAGILGLITVEEKIVRNDSKTLLVMRLTDRSGQFEVRSWVHSDAEFLQFREKPIMLQRVRVTMYAGQRVGELLDGPLGTIITQQFDQSDLIKYWNE